MIPIALFLPLVFRTSRTPAVVEIQSLRRSGLRVRRTSYDGLVVDERLLTTAFPQVHVGPQRDEIFVLERGTASFHAAEGTFAPAVGEPWLISRHHLEVARFENARFFEIDWPAERPPLVQKLPSASFLELAHELPRLGHDGDAQRTYLERLVTTVESTGIAVPLSVRRWDEDRPSDRDLRLAAALADQLANLQSEATIPHLGDDAELSPRQLQRVVEAFNLRYGINSRNWRDTRSRWRVQIAATLLSVPSLSVAEVASEVGLASATVLARAFASHHLPTPREVRARLTTT